MRILAIVPIVFLVAACERAAADPRGVDRAETFLTVTASGRADTRPDEAVDPSVPLPQATAADDLSGTRV